jgi:hypothetical protein
MYSLFTFTAVIFIAVAISTGNFALYTNVDHCSKTSSAIHKHTYFQILLLCPYVNFSYDTIEKSVIAHIHFELSAKISGYVILG